MDNTAALTDLEHLYDQVLTLTREQETCLRAGNVASLPEILARKSAALARAQELTSEVMVAGRASQIPGFQDALNRIGAILAQTVSAEDRCQALVPTPSPGANRRQAAAAYGATPPKR